jgi:UPF0716 protein FxsA
LFFGTLVAIYTLYRRDCASITLLPVQVAMPFLLLFILIPVCEMWLLIKVGSHIGALPTIGLVLLTAMIGLALLRQQGFATLLRANQKMEAGQLPAQEIVDGLFLAVGGALLLTPGFFTDAIGFVCLIPGLRRLLLGRLLHSWISKPGQGFHFRASSFRSGPGFDPRGETFEHEPQRTSSPSQPQPRRPDVLEGDFKREE